MQFLVLGALLLWEFNRTHSEALVLAEQSSSVGVGQMSAWGAAKQRLPQSSTQSISAGGAAAFWYPVQDI